MDLVYLTKEEINKIYKIKYNLLMFDIHMFQETCMKVGIKYNL